MANQYRKTLFSDKIRKMQEEMGSREFYEKADEGPIENSSLGQNEIQFIQNRDSLYMATVTEEGWPYVQHRGGPKGFVKVLSPTEIGFSDYTGNRQYISLGNVQSEKRVSLILVDYPNKKRLKIAGKAYVENADSTYSSDLKDADYKAKVERLWRIEIVGFDWNCPRHITPRFTAEEVEAIMESRT